MRSSEQNRSEILSSTQYEVARQALRDHLSRRVEHIAKERNELEALPGYRKAFDRAKSSEEVRTRLAPLTPQIAAIHHRYVADEEALMASSERLVTLFAKLDTADIRQLFDDTVSEGATLFSLVCSLLARGRNMDAVGPLIERLQSNISARPQYKCKNSWDCFVDAIAKRTLLRSMERETDEMHRVLERLTTLSVLGRLQDQRAEAAIRPFLNDADSKVREAAQTALSRLSEA